MNDQFSALQQSATKGMVLLPASSLASPASAEVAALHFAMQHSNDLPPGFNADVMEAQLDHWLAVLHHASRDDALPATIQRTLALAATSMCSGVTRLLPLIASHKHAAATGRSLQCASLEG